MRGKLLLTACMLQACTPSAPSAPIVQTPIGLSTVAPAPLPSVSGPVPAAGDPESTARVSDMLKRVSAVRGLAATRTVPGLTLERDALLRRLREHVDQEVPKSAIENEGAIDALMGLVPPKFNYEGAIYALLEAQLAGYYEPEGGIMLLASDLEGLMAEGTLAHELTHALQDQHYDLKTHMKYEPGKSDESLALQCLAEGDATSAMYDVMFDTLAPGKSILAMPDDMFVRQVKEAMESGPGSDSPRAMREGLTAPYVDGVVFVHALRRHGGWPEVDHAWQNPPTTTEQILHVDKFNAHELAIDVPAPTIAALGAGFAVVDTDTFGELTLRISFAEWTSDRDAGAAAAHWGGDRVVLARKADDVALAWRVRYDADAPKSDAFAERAFAVVSAGMIQKLGPATSKDGSSVCFEKPGRATLAFTRAGRDVLLAAGPANAADMTPHGDCALVKKWSQDILGIAPTPASAPRKK